MNELYRTKTVVKIGQGGISEGRISEAAAQRALNALKDFRTSIDQYGVSKIKAFATSAFRSSANAMELVDKVYQETGITIHVIGGQEEASLIFDGVNLALGKMSETILVVDIGGGSVEFIIGKEEQVLWMESYEIGGQRMMDRFFTEDPISMDSVGQMKEFLHSRLQSLISAIERYNPTILVGSSGSFETLSMMYAELSGISIDNDKELPLTLEAISKFHTQLTHADREERLAIPGMAPMRVDMIVVASILIDYLCNQHEFQRVRVSRYALKEGALSRLLQE